MAGLFKVPGFRAGAVSAGIRKGNTRKPDLALMVCDGPATAAGTFTQNKVQAAPVILSRARIKSGSARAILANAGCANAMTGPQGMKAVRDTTAEAARLLGIRPSGVLAASTGVIGIHLPSKKICEALPKLVKGLRPDGFAAAAGAIMTTDKSPKIARVNFPVGKKKATILGMAKGAGMIGPDMATMFAFLFTDAAVQTPALSAALSDAVGISFNRVRVDGDTSTNDCAFILAGGALKNASLSKKSKATASFAKALQDLCFELAVKMARDGEGATRIMDLRIAGAKSMADAIIIGRTIADSPLVKTALHGADPNWGRIAAAAGRAGAPMNPNRLFIAVGGVPCVRGGVPIDKFDEKRAAAAMRKPTVVIDVKLGMGNGAARFISSDLTAEYVRINAHYRT